jgi:hypothetical protein
MEHDEAVELRWLRLTLNESPSLAFEAGSEAIADDPA